MHEAFRFNGHHSNSRGIEAVGGRDKLDPACLAAKLVNLDKGQTEARDPKKRGAPVGDRAKIVDEPAQRLLHLIEGADSHHQSAE